MALGKWNVDEMLREMTVTQLNEWIIFSELEPWGPERADFRAGVVAAAVYNSAGKKFSGHIAAKDLTPTFGDTEVEEAPKKPKKDWRIMKALSQALALQSQEQAAGLLPVSTEEPRVRKHR